MALPFNTPYTFATATGSIPLSQLDSNFSTVVQAVNAIGNGANALSNVTITGGSASNVTISSLAAPLPAASGGTGLASPGASGNVLTSNGTGWFSQAGGLPPTSGNAGKALVTDGSTVSWSSTLNRGTAQTPTTTNADFTGIPSWARRITIVFAGVSTNSADQVEIRIGAGNVVSGSGYVSTVWQGGSTNVGDTSTAGFLIDGGGQGIASVRDGSVVLHNIDGNTWVASGIINRSNGANNINVLTGTKTLTGSLDIVRIRAGTTATFDAGTINIFWE